VEPSASPAPLIEGRPHGLEEDALLGAQLRALEGRRDAARAELDSDETLVEVDASELARPSSTGSAKWKMRFVTCRRW